MEKINFKLKNDKYRKARGGKAYFINLICIRCNNIILKYQKDGDGDLKRCYLNRIFYPSELEKLQYSSRNPKDFQNLVCKNCNTVIGTPMLHHGGRLAFKLRKGFYLKQRK